MRNQEYVYCPEEQAGVNCLKGLIASSTSLKSLLQAAAVVTVTWELEYCPFNRTCSLMSSALFSYLWIGNSLYYLITIKEHVPSANDYVLYRSLSYLWHLHSHNLHFTNEKIDRVKMLVQGHTYGKWGSEG